MEVLRFGCPGPVYVVRATGQGFASRGARTPLVALGAGGTLLQAARRARAELVERLSGFFRGDEPRVRASLGEIGSQGIHPNDVLLYSRRQHRRGDAHPFDAAARLDWSPLLSVTSGEWRYLPTQLLFYRYPGRGSRVFGRADSNGAAAGRSFAGAAARGLLELIERDSVALWWYNRVPRPAVELHDAPDPWVRRVGEWYESQGRECWALDLTSDLAVPVVAAVSRRNDGGAGEELIVGFGAHPDGAQALRRALLEMCQMLAVVRAVHDGRVDPSAAARRWWRDVTVKSDPYLRSLPGRPRRLGLRRSALRPADLFRRTAAQLAKRGLDVLVADQTRRGYGLQVAKVVVPGLRPWGRRFGRGRLYDAPVAAGWQPAATRESNLSPRVVFF